MQDKYFLHFALAFWSIILGAFLCAVYDVFRLFRLRKKQNAFLLFVYDVLFCLIAAVSLLILFFNLSFGRPRIYAVLLCIVGFLIWRVTVSRLVMAIMNRLFGFIERILITLKRKIVFNLKRISRFIYTSAYCRTTVSKIKGYKFKRKEKENGTKETHTS